MPPSGLISPVHAVISYIRHWLTAVNEHSLHAPFIYGFYTRTLKGQADKSLFSPIEEIRKRLQNSKQRIVVARLGASSKVNNRQARPVAAIARKGVTSPAVSRLLYRIIRDYNHQNIVELGTSFGLNTMYLATNPETRVYTFEGCTNTARIARDNFTAAGFDNVRLIPGNIDQTLPGFCQSFAAKVDLAFIDANHNYAPTINYVEHLLPLCHKNSMIIVDDIYWSPAMTKAWEQLKQLAPVTTTVDLYQLGILIFKPGLKKTHYRLF